MSEGRRSRRRRGRRGGGGRPQDQEGASQDAQPESSEPDRPVRRDSRRSVRGDGPPGPPPGPSNIRRAPQQGGARRDDRGRRFGEPRSDGERPRRPDGGRRVDGGRRGDGERRHDGQRSRQEDRGARSFEPPTPQDPRSIELGAAFKEAQVAMRDARKALDKRRAESGDEPDWLVEQLAAAEARFAEASTAWVEHLETTNRKVVRAR
jgi:ribonuclease E